MACVAPWLGRLPRVFFLISRFLPLGRVVIHGVQEAPNQTQQRFSTIKFYADSFVVGEGRRTVCHVRGHQQQQHPRRAVACIFVLYCRPVACTKKSVPSTRSIMPTIYTTSFAFGNNSLESDNDVRCSFRMIFSDILSIFDVQYQVFRCSFDTRTKGVIIHE